MKFIMFLIIYLLSCSFTFIKSDIPVHCLSHQIVGKWVFYQTEATYKNLKERYNHNCGIRDHTRVDQIITARNFYNFIKTKKIEVNFDESHEASITKAFKGFKGSKVI